MESVLDDVIGEFADFCGGRDLDPEETLAILNSQDWKTNKLIGDFAKFCRDWELCSKKTVKLLIAQDWKGAKEDLRVNSRKTTDGESGSTRSGTRR